MKDFFLQPLHDSFKGFPLMAVREQLAYVRFAHRRLPLRRPAA